MLFQRGLSCNCATRKREGERDDEEGRRPTEVQLHIAPADKGVRAAGEWARVGAAAGRRVTGKLQPTPQSPPPPMRLQE